MFENLEILRLAQGLASHAASRQSVVARNLANADTPGFQQRDIGSFSEVWNETATGQPLKRTRSSHLESQFQTPSRQERIVTDAVAEPNGNTVSVESEIRKAAEIRQQHDLALSLYRSSVTMLRTSLGR